VRAFEEVDRLAREAGVAVLGSELIGLAPGAALDEAIADRVRLAHFDPERSIVERRLTP
jgi:glutamate formiminotransferase